ncbi:MAG: hypothetical protein IPL35_16360 [Sphingobacteriales bacterium]|nr:hypothetical protein [Sphingobacteriales bacterium]
MAQHNQISASLTAADLTELLKAVAVIKEKLPFLVNLTPEERQSYARMGDKSLAFVEKSLDYAKENPQLLPPFLNVAEFEKDMLLVNDLRRLLRPLTAIVESIDDTVMLAGSESYSAALIFYQAVKMAKMMNIAGTDSIYEDLAKRFSGRGLSEEAPAPPPTEEPEV